MMKLISKYAWGKKIFRRESWLIHPVKVIYFTIVFEKYVIFWYCNIYDEVPSSSSKIIEQIDFIEELVLRKISKANDTAPYKKQVDQTYFFFKKKP